MQSILIAVLVVILFAAMNPQVITVRLIFWQVDSPLVLIIVVTFAVGFIAGAIRLFPGFWKHRTKAKKSSKALTALEEERNSLKEHATALEEERDNLKEHATALENKVQQLSSEDDSPR